MALAAEKVPNVCLKAFYTGMVLCPPNFSGVSIAEKEFLDSLPLSQQCTEEEEELLRFLFENKLKKVREREL